MLSQMVAKTGLLFFPKLIFFWTNGEWSNTLPQNTPLVYIIYVDVLVECVPDKSERVFCGLASDAWRRFVEVQSIQLETEEN